MPLPAHPVTLTAEQISVLNQKLSESRHNINNHLSLVVATVEVLQKNPNLAPRLMPNLAAQPERIIKEIQAFSEAFEAALSITRDKPFTPFMRG